MATPAYRFAETDCSSNRTVMMEIWSMEMVAHRYAKLKLCIAAEMEVVQAQAAAGLSA